MCHSEHLSLKLDMSKCCKQSNIRDTCVKCHIKECYLANSDLVYMDILLYFHQQNGTWK